MQLSWAATIFPATKAPVINHAGVYLSAATVGNDLTLLSLNKIDIINGLLYLSVLA